MDTAAARTEVLRRIRAAIAKPALAPEAIAAEWRTLARDYNAAPKHPREECIALFEDRLRDYDAGVHHCDEAGLPDLIAQILAERGKIHILIPEGLPAAWLPSTLSFTADNRLTLEAPDQADGVLTAATLAIAETGTILLQDAPGQGRRAATLLPDYHLCVVPASAVVETVPEAIRALQPTAQLATTFFSGPSATADIEMTRIKGVHGPRFVDVIITT
jgi:L-lactate dehydrogenase complex protein LldG